MKQILRRNGLLLTCSIVLGIIYSVCSVLSSKILQRVIDTSLEGNFGSFKEVLLFAVGFLVILGAIIYIYERVNNTLINYAIRDYRNQVYSGIINRNYKSFNSVNSAEYISSLTNDMKLVEENYIVPLLTSIQHLFVFIATLIMLFSLNVIVALSLIGSVILMFIIPSILGKNLQDKQERVSDRFALLTSKSKDIFSGFEVIKTFNVFKHFDNIFYNANTNITHTKMKADNLLALNETASNILGALCQFVVVFVSTYLIIKGEITAGTSIALIQLSGTFIMPVIMILTNIPKIKGVEGIISKLNAFSKIEQLSSNKLISNFHDEILIKDVSFAYDEENLVLQDVNLKFEKGKKYAILGKSGCGKSTLAKLLSGYYDNYTGEIIFDGKNTAEYNLQSSHSLISTIHQNVYMFDTNISNNITLYDNYSEKNLQTALLQSGAENFINDFPDGINSMVGENGNKLSGGQRQRIAIARALVKDTPILVLDEGTSSIDKQTANEIERQLLNIEDLTLITITHNLDSNLLTKYDELIFMENGRIVEFGAFDSLINNNQGFSHFFSQHLLSK